MQGRDDEDGEQHRPGQDHQQVFVNGVRNVLKDLGKAGHGDGVRVPVVSWTVVDDVLEMVQEFGKICPVPSDGRVVVHAHNDGGRVPNSITVHVVGEIPVPVAVNGRVHVVGVFDERVKSPVRLLNDLVDSVLVWNGILATLRELFAVQRNR